MGVLFLAQLSLERNSKPGAHFQGWPDLANMFSAGKTGVPSSATTVPGLDTDHSLHQDAAVQVPLVVLCFMPALCFGTAVFKDGDGMPVASDQPVVGEELNGLPNRVARHFLAGRSAMWILRVGHIRLRPAAPPRRHRGR